MIISEITEVFDKVVEENKNFRQNLPKEEADFIDSVLMLLAQAYANSPEDNGLVVSIDEMTSWYTVKGSKQCEKLKDLIYYYQQNELPF